MNLITYILLICLITIIFIIYIIWFYSKYKIKKIDYKIKKDILNDNLKIIKNNIKKK